MRKVCVIGIWHQGAVGAACLADLGYLVIGVDNNKDRVERLNEGRAPLYEPGLDDLIAKGISSGRLSFTNSISEGLANTRDILVMFDTPVDENDDVNLTEIFLTAREIAPYLQPKSTILITAQVPVGTCDQFSQVIRQTNPKVDFGIAYSPENLRLGQAIERFKHPSLPVIGANDSKTLDHVEEMLSVFHTPWFRTNIRTAEMTKHALNAFLAISVCFGNELGNLCDEVGADAQQIATALRLEPRIGAKAMLFPGLGFSGGTLARDMRTLKHIGERSGYETYLIDGAWKTNERQNQIVRRKLQKIFGALKGIQIGVLGLTYKPDTSTLRRSAAIEIIRDLVSFGAVVKAYDPKADREELKQHSEFQFYEDAYLAAEGCDVLVLITPWAEFRTIDYERIRTCMARPVLFDTQNMLDSDYLRTCGFNYFGIGRGTVNKLEEI
ncbi:UDP-glucose/GDP-mannose dehydrogenase family protein [bacterium]|nr:MAG: UDP-glucose/GDP-mannose dehydrogenase family protein [bacterium]